MAVKKRINIEDELAELKNSIDELDLDTPSKSVTKESQSVKEYFKKLEFEDIVQPLNKSVYINFNEYLGRDDLRAVSVLPIEIRCFYKEIDKIAKSLNTIMNLYPEFMLKYLNIIMEILYFFNDHEGIDKTNITKKEINELKDIIINFINDEKLKEIIVTIVEETYTISLDDESKTRTVNTDLQLIDKNNKVFLEAAFHLRLLIPIFSLIKKHIDINFLYVFFSNYVIKYYTEGNTNHILNKLHKIICSRVTSTKMSDRVIWLYLMNHKITPTILTETIRKSILEQIIPKIDLNTSAIKYLHTIIKFKIDFTFTYNYNLSFKTIRANTDDDDDVDEKEKLEFKIFNQTYNEGEYITNLITIEREVENLYKYNKKVIDDYNEFKKLGINLNTIQIYFNEIYWDSQFKLVTDYDNKILLLFKMINELEERNFIEIPKLLRAVLKENTYLNINQIKRKLTGTLGKLKSYKDLLDDYLPFIDKINNKNFIGQMFTMSQYDFIDYENNDLEINENQYLIECIMFVKSL